VSINKTYITLRFPSLPHPHPHPQKSPYPRIHTVSNLATQIPNTHFPGIRFQPVLKSPPSTLHLRPSLGPPSSHLSKRHPPPFGSPPPIPQSPNVYPPYPLTFSFIKPSCHYLYILSMAPFYLFTPF
jgi:hypothetical protein